jgi:hypothetical protein
VAIFKHSLPAVFLAAARAGFHALPKLAMARRDLLLSRSGFFADSDL